MKTAALVLAAGGSARLGQPKQLLPYEGESLVRRTVCAARDAGCSPLIVVVGREQKEIGEELQDLPVTLLPNENWNRGLGTSLRAGVPALAPEVDAVIILACDQPHVDADLLRRLLEEHHRTGKPMVASAYAQTIGIPALFARACFPRLLSLGDDAGAKSLLLSQPNDISTVDFAGGAVDVDTPEDYRALFPRGAGRGPEGPASAGPVSRSAASHPQKT